MKSIETPPWHAGPTVGQFSNDRRLTQAEIDTITAWVDGGAKEGEPRDMPPAQCQRRWLRLCRKIT